MPRDWLRRTSLKWPDVRLDVKAINRLVLHFCAVAVGWLLWSCVICVFCRQSLLILNINFIPVLMSTNSLVTQLEKNIVNFVVNSNVMMNYNAKGATKRLGLKIAINETTSSCGVIWQKSSEHLQNLDLARIWAVACHSCCRILFIRCNAR